jgi:hypothetical protein
MHILTSVSQSPSVHSEMAFFNVARADAPFSVPGRLSVVGGGQYEFHVDLEHALWRSMPVTKLTAAQARSLVTKVPLY